MADVERSLISKAINKGATMDLHAEGIYPEHFADPECAEVYEFMLDFTRTHSQSPPNEIINKEFPDFSPVASQSPLSYHIEEFILHTKERTAVDLVRDFHEALEDPDEIAEIEVRALEMARQLTEIVPAPRAMHFSDKSRLAEYDRRAEIGDPIGSFMGVPSFDDVTKGVQGHELVTAVAYMGTGKSTLMRHWAYSFYLQDKTSLIITLEEEAEAVMRKIDSMAAGIKYIGLKALELGVKEKEQWKVILDKAYEDRQEKDIIIRDDIRHCSVDRVLAETMRYKPDAVFVDYLELMSTPKSAGGQHWEKISFSGVGLKQNARIMGIPHFTAAQLDRAAGKGEITLANIGYQSVGKHSDIVVGLRQDEEQETRNEMELVLLKNRDGKKNVVAKMNWELDEMFIKEKGISERFPRRTKETSSEKKKAQQLDRSRTSRGAHIQNPWGGKKRRGANPITARSRRTLQA